MKKAKAIINLIFIFSTTILNAQNDGGDFMRNTGKINVVVGVLHGKYNITAVEYLPEEVTDRLIPFPYGKNFIAKAATWESHIPYYLGVAAVYMLIYCLLTSRRFLKSDL